MHTKDIHGVHYKMHKQLRYRLSYMVMFMWCLFQDSRNNFAVKKKTSSQMLCTMQIALYNCQEGKQTRPHVMPVRQDVSLCAHLGHRTLPSVDGVSCFTLSRKRWFIGFLDIADANFMRNVHNLKRSFSYYFFVLCL